MTRLKIKHGFWLAVLFILTLGLTAPGFSANVGIMTKEELKPIMNNDNVAILDVRKGRDWSSSEFKITGAVRVDTKDIVSDAGQFSKDQTLVLYCA